MEKNIKKNEINFNEYYKIARNSTPEEKYRKIVPGIEEKFSKENLIDFNVQENDKTIKLNCYFEEPEKLEMSKGIIFFFHGLNSHSNTFAHLAKFFAKENFICSAFDQRGYLNFL